MSFDDGMRADGRSGLGDGNPSPRFAGTARAAGFLVLAGLPFVSGSTAWGSLGLYDRTQEGLDRATIVDATVVAGVLARLLLNRIPASPTAAELVTPATRSTRPAASSRRSVASASTKRSALLRGYAIDHDRLVRDVAIEVLAGELRFDG